MKKRLICFVLTIIMAVLLVPPVYAASGDWILMGDAEYIIHGEDKYYPVEFPYYCFVDHNGSFATVDLEIEDQRFAQTYASSFAYVPQGYVDMVIEVVLFKEGVMTKTVHYVEEAYLDEALNLSNGKVSSYVIENDSLNFIPITEADLDCWSNDESITIAGDDVENYYQYGIYACDESGVFMHETGMVLQDILDEDEFYLLKYEECDPICFEDGIFIGNSPASCTVYEVEDDLTDLINPEPISFYAPYGTPDGEVSGFAMAILVFIFGVIPFGTVTFGVVMAIICKDKKYRTPFIVLTSSAGLALAAFMVLLAIALM